MLKTNIRAFRGGKLSSFESRLMSTVGHQYLPAARTAERTAKSFRQSAGKRDRLWRLSLEISDREKPFCDGQRTVLHAWLCFLSGHGLPDALPNRLVYDPEGLVRVGIGLIGDRPC